MARDQTDATPTPATAPSAAFVSDQGIFLPEEHASERWLAILVFLLSCLYLLVFRRYVMMDPDEGIVLEGALRILRGEVLYRDFFSFLTPGSFYFLALFLKLFGNSLLVARTVLIFVGGACSVVTYLLARRVCSRRSALITAGIATLTSLPFRFLVLHNWDSTLWACLALYCAVRFVESERAPWAFGAGSLASVTFLFEQSKGAGLLLGLAVGLWAIAALNRRPSLWQGVRIVGFALGLAWPLLAATTYFAGAHGLPAMLADWFWPFQHYSTANHVPYGYQNWSDSTRHLVFGGSSWGVRLTSYLTVSPLLWIPALPIGALGLLGYWGLRMWRRQARPAKCAYYVLVTSVLSGLLLSVVVARADITHFMYLQPLFCLVLAWLMDGRDIPGRIFKAIRPLLNAYLLIAFTALAMALFLRAAFAPQAVDTRRGRITLPDRDTVIEYVQERVPPGEKIFVYPYLPLYYFLTETSSAISYDYFQPGMHTPEQAVEMVSQLASTRPRVVLFEMAFEEKIPTSWPRTPLAPIASDPVADHILLHYRACAILKSPMGWRFLFMTRKDLACP